MENEAWKAAVGYPFLSGLVEVSDAGRVRTVESVRAVPRTAKMHPNQPATQRRPGKVVSLWIGNNGYLHVSFKVGPTRRKFLVHRLVALAFVPGHFEGASVDHIDGDKLNNLPANLQWVTLARNTALQWQTGLIDIRGERHPSAKLSNADTRAISVSGDRVVELAERYSVSTALIYKIRQGRKPVVA